MNLNLINRDFLEQKAKIIFIVLVAFSVVLLLVITYFVYFDNSDKSSNKSDDTRNKPTPRKNNNSQKNTNNTVKKPSVNNSNNNSNNNLNSMLKNIEVNKVNNSGLLDNVKENTHQDYTKSQVYNISNNIFTYDDAKAACKAHNAELATYEQVMDSYKNGAEWCNYGWSDKQMALFPTQKHTWQKLQEDTETSNACGNWGVNGGYFENPNTLFGANCYGIKPEPKPRERMGPPPVTQKEQDILAKVARFKEEKDDLNLAPFNKNNWSRK
jgi:hypothetical protein